MKTARIFFLLFILATLLPLAASAATTSVEVYSIPFADLDMMEQTVRAIVGPQATVALDRKGHRLIVSGTLDQHAEVRDLVKKLNVPPKNIRIDVKFDDTGGSDRFEAGVSGGGAVIYDGQDVGGRIEVNPRLQNTTVTRSSRTTQSLLTMSGREAVLKVGESVPYLDYITTYGRRGRYVEQAAVQWQDVGSYLHIQPTVLGDGQTLRVKLTPALSGMSADGPNRVRYNELATEVVVRNGESIRIGGLNEHSDFYSKFLIGVDRGGRHRNLDIVLTPRIVEPGGP